jgi:dipeptidyl-peptidase-4
LTEDGSAVLFLRTGPRDPTLALFETSVATGVTRPLVTPAELLQGSPETLSVAEAARRERQRIVDRGFTTFDLSKDGRRVLLPLSGRMYVFERAGDKPGQIRAFGKSGDAVIDPRFSPDGKSVAFVRNNDLFVTDVDSGRERRLTRGGTETRTHGLAEFVAQEEMERHEGYFWSPDSRFVAYAEVDQSELPRFTIADPAHPEKPANLFPYPRAGTKNARVRLGIVAATGGKVTWIRWDQERFPYLARVIWKEKTAPLSLLVQTRDQRTAAFMSVDPRTGATTMLHEETDDAWVELEHGLPRWLPDGSGFLAVSERSGRRALERHDRTGKRVDTIVPGEMGFATLLGISRDSQRVQVTTALPTSTRIWEVPLTAKGAKDTTTKDAATSGPAAAPQMTLRAVSPDEIAEHNAVFAESANAYVDNRTSATSFPEATLYRRANPDAAWEKVGVLPSVAAAPPFLPNLTLTAVKAGPLTFHAAVVRPRKFVAGNKYPVIVNVYGGPTSLTVRADQRHYLMAQWMADHGAIVVAIDNRGTPRRDRAWSRAIKGNFGDVPLDDQVAGLRGLLAAHPEMDGNRVGIYGWSFGGYMAALAVMKRPDVFKVGVAGAPVVDWQDYDTHYTERYLGLPQENATGYGTSNLVPLAKSLKRPLLVIHGTGDDNVYFFHSLKLADALFRAGRRFDFLPLSVTHQVPDPVVRERLWGRVAEFLLRHLR